MGTKRALENLKLPNPIKQILITPLGFTTQPINHPPYTEWWIHSVDLDTGEMLRHQTLPQIAVQMMDSWFIPGVGFRPVAFRIHVRNKIILYIEEARLDLEKVGEASKIEEQQLRKCNCCQNYVDHCNCTFEGSPCK